MLTAARAEGGYQTSLAACGICRPEKRQPLYARALAQSIRERSGVDVQGCRLGRAELSKPCVSLDLRHGFSARYRFTFTNRLQSSTHRLPLGSPSAGPWERIADTCIQRTNMARASDRCG